MEDILVAVRKELILCEQTYTVKEKELDGFSRVTATLQKVEVLRQAKEEEGENSDPLDELLTKCYVKLNEILKQARNGEPMFNYPFEAWAHEIESDIRVQDPLVLSFESDHDDSMSFRTGLSRRISGMPSTKSGSRILNVLKSNGKWNSKEDELSSFSGTGDKFRYLTSFAWTFAVIGMVITIGFLAADFWNAHQNVAIQVSKREPNPKTLPGITICTTHANLPSYSEFPSSEFPGLPLFGISSYVRSKPTKDGPSMQLGFDDLRMNTSRSPIENVIVSRENGTCRSKSAGFDANRANKALQSSYLDGTIDVLSRDRDACLYCFRIGVKKKETLLPERKTKNSKPLNPTIQLDIFVSRLFQACQSSSLQRNILTNQIFHSELYEYAEKLEERGILDFSGYEYDVLNTTRFELHWRYRVEFYCNVYFYAGLFYPTLNNTNVSYRYDPNSSELWVKTGMGPYFTSFRRPINAEYVFGPDQEAVNSDTYSSSGILLFAEDAESVDPNNNVSPDTSIGAIDAISIAVIGFKRVVEQGETKYQIKKILSPVPPSSFKIYDSFSLSFDFYTYETEEIQTNPTMSWSEFLTDVFEFIGLFTGICIFTLIVAPATSFV